MRPRPTSGHPPILVCEARLVTLGEREPFEFWAMGFGKGEVLNELAMLAGLLHRDLES